MRIHIPRLTPCAPNREWISPTSQPIMEIKELEPDYVAYNTWKASLREKWPVGLRRKATERGMERKQQ
jgi:hypothetical protein